MIEQITFTISASNHIERDCNQWLWPLRHVTSNIGVAWNDGTLILCCLYVNVYKLRFDCVVGLLLVALLDLA